MNDEAIFTKALTIASPAQRDAFLDQVCAHDVQRRRLIEGLLQAHENPDSFLNAPSAGVDAMRDLPLSEGPGTIIGQYKLLEQIGEGGFGVVFMAEQQEPIRRKVALKVLKPGMDSRQVVARFEAERQALALMDHPSIAHVYDGGPTPSGRPYFVMELVRGSPITEYCDQNQLAIRERLELFMTICQAVQHAHQKGIIHRDLKPANILIASHDGTPVPKVIDFGIAKAMSGQLTDKTLFTAFAQMIGTPLYMSPEQAGQSNLDADTRSDIYSLGVLLYELLTGTTPFDKEQLSKLGIDELRRIIREEEPPNPSTRLSTLGQAATTASTNRKSDPRKLIQQVRAELDWIVMKSLEKDRNRRYETASAFAADVQRYLNDEPVQACPPSAMYRARKFVRRHKAGLAISALALLFIVILSATAGLWYQSEEDRSARELEMTQTRQNQLTRDITNLLDDTEMLRKEIHAKLADPIKVCELLSKIDAWHGDLAKARVAWQSAKNLAASNEDVLAVELAKRLQQMDYDLTADESDWKIAKNLDDIRIDAATLVDTEWTPEAVAPKYEHFFRALGFDWEIGQPTQIASTILRGRLRYVLVGAIDDWNLKSKENRTQRLETAYLLDPDPWRNQVRILSSGSDRRALENLTETADFRIQSPQILCTLALQLAAQNGNASAFLRTALINYPQDFWLHFALGNYAENSDQKIGCFQAALALRPTSSPAHVNLGFMLDKKHDVDRAIQHYRRALDLNPNYINAHNHLGNSLVKKKDFDHAIQHFRKALDLSPKEAAIHSNLGSALAGKKDFDEAIRHLKKSLELNPNYAIAYRNLGGVLVEKKEFDGAILCLRKALNVNPNDADAHYGLGQVLYYKKDLDGAIQHFRKAIDLTPDFSSPHYSLGIVLSEMKDFEGAIMHYRKTLDLDPKHGSAHNNLSSALIAKNDVDGAIQHLLKALDLNPNHAAAHFNLGNALKRKNDLDGAIRHFRKALELDPDKPGTHFSVGAILLARRNLDEAIQHFRKALDLDPKLVSAHNDLGIALRFKNDREGAMQHFRKVLDLDPSHARAHTNLGYCLAETGKYEEALVHIRRGKELGSKQSDGPYPTAKIIQDIERKVQLAQQVPAALKGDIPLTSLQDWLGYVDICQRKKAYSKCFRLWKQLFAKQPALAETGYRYRAARDAVLACGNDDSDAAIITDADRILMRSMANEWLRAGLDSWTKQLQTKQPDVALTLTKALLHWQENPDFAGVRDEPNLAKLSAQDRKSWQKLWTELEQLRRVAGAMFKETTLVAGTVTPEKRESPHEVKLQRGTFYVIDLESKAFDTFLRLHDAQGKKLAENDDIAPAINTNSRLIFTPQADGIYRLVASAFQASGTGPYVLTIREFVK